MNVAMVQSGRRVADLGSLSSGQGQYFSLTGACTFRQAACNGARVSCGVVGGNEASHSENTLYRMSPSVILLSLMTVEHSQRRRREYHRL